MNTKRTKLGAIFYALTINAGKFFISHPVVYFILSYTWGIIGTLLGHIISLILLPFGRFKKFNFTYYVELRKSIDSGLEMGTTFFVGKDCSIHLLCHEFGHGMQNALFGPFVFLLVWIPSVIRFNIRIIRIRYGKPPRSGYDDVWFEGTATWLGFYAYRGTLE